MKKDINNPTFRNPRAENILPVWDSNCEILMVGSITAKDGMDKGFYYASARNQLWELLDYALNIKTDTFSQLKNKLIKNHNNFKMQTISDKEFDDNKSVIKTDFAKKLLENRIAMCDVFESCYFNGNGSLDQDIILNDERYPIKTYKDLLTQIISSSKIKKVIVNSRFVEMQFKKMNIPGDYITYYVVSPSPRRGSIDKKREEWKIALSNISD